MKTNKEIPTVAEIFEERGHGYSNDVFATIKYLIGLHLTKQAEFIAEKAEIDYFGYPTVDKQSIINAGEEYKNSVK